MTDSKQLKTELIALCDYALIDKANKVSVIGIFNEMNVTQFPGGMPNAYLVATLQGSADTSYKLTITAQDEDKKDIFAPLNLEAKTSFTGKTNLTINITPLVFPHAGEFKISILDTGKEIGSTSIQVIHAKQGGQTYEYKQTN